jgi:hypothetical protein
MAKPIAGWIEMRKEVWMLAAIIMLGIAIRLVVMYTLSVYNPPIDAFIVDKESANVILHLQNPYTYSFPVHDYYLNVFAYLPMVPIYYVPFYVLGDFRFGSIFADVLIILAAYWIAKSYNRGFAFYAPLAYALLPPSIWLSSIAGTNIMVGTAFLMLFFAALLQKKYGVAAVFLGLGVAANQMVALMLPLFAFYYWREHKVSRFTLSLLVSATIILPFYLSSPSNFIYDVVEFQFLRPAQSNGSYSLYHILNSGFGIQLSFYIRATLFAVPFILSAFWSRRKPNLLLISAGLLLFLEAFVLPINGFWTYFLPSLAILCAFIPAAVERVMQKITRHPSYSNSKL